MMSQKDHAIIIAFAFIEKQVHAFLSGTGLNASLSLQILASPWNSQNFMFNSYIHADEWGEVMMNFACLLACIPQVLTTFPTSWASMVLSGLNRWSIVIPTTLSAPYAVETNFSNVMLSKPPDNATANLSPCFKPTKCYINKMNLLEGRVYATLNFIHSLMYHWIDS
jgi:hypothetical protein